MTVMKVFASIYYGLPRSGVLPYTTPGAFVSDDLLCLPDVGCDTRSSPSDMGLVVSWEEIPTLLSHWDAARCVSESRVGFCIGLPSSKVAD
jgi:hypothetical protein